MKWRISSFVSSRWGIRRTWTVIRSSMSSGGRRANNWNIVLNWGWITLMRWNSPWRWSTWIPTFNWRHCSKWCRSMSVSYSHIARSMVKNFNRNSQIFLEDGSIGQIIFHINFYAFIWKTIWFNTKYKYSRHKYGLMICCLEYLSNVIGSYWRHTTFPPFI